MTSSLSAGTPPVQQPDPQPDQLAGREPLEGLLGRRDLELLGLLDQRAHDVGLAPGGHLGAHRGPRLVLVERSVGPHGRAIGVRPGAARRAPTRRGRRRPSSPRCAGSAWPSSPARRAPPRPRSCSRSAARCSTPKRCCSSITTTPSDRNSMPSWIERVGADQRGRPAPARDRRGCAAARPRSCGW